MVITWQITTNVFTKKESGTGKASNNESVQGINKNILEKSDKVKAFCRTLELWKSNLMNFLKTVQLKTNTSKFYLTLSKII